MLSKQSDGAVFLAAGLVFDSQQGGYPQLDNRTGALFGVRMPYQRCKQRRWVESHHIQLLSQGGADQIENLTTPCFAHHRMRHRETA